MNNMFSIKKLREAVDFAIATMRNYAEVDEGADDGHRLTEGWALTIIGGLPGLFQFEETLEKANSNSATTERRSTIDIKLRGPLAKLDYNFSGLSITTEISNEEALEYLDANKLAIILWRAYLSKINSYHINTRDSHLEWSMYVNTHMEVTQIEYERNNYTKLSSVLLGLQEGLATDLDTNAIDNARRRFASLRENVVDRIEYQNRNNAEEVKATKSKKFAQILSSGEFVKAGVVEQQLLKTYEMLPSNGLVARTWGFEVESPHANGVEAPAGIEKGEDGSLRSYEANSDCECSCNGCEYHDCSCDYCDNRSDGDEHCGGGECSTADSAEFRTTGGVQRIISSGLYTLCKDLINNEAEINDTAGTHIHVYARDLTTNQVGQVLASYKRLEPLMAVIAGRADVNYARDIPVEYIRAALKKRGAKIFTDKPRAVTTVHLTNNRGTIEFRQMDCNYDANRITLWAWICRAFVTAAKRGMTVRDVMEVTDLISLIEVFAKFNVMLHDENPELVVYGSKTDAGNFTVVTHEVA